jgi:hypothetical protein
MPAMAPSTRIETAGSFVVDFELILLKEYEYGSLLGGSHEFGTLA